MHGTKTRQIGASSFIDGFSDDAITENKVTNNVL